MLYMAGAQLAGHSMLRLDATPKKRCLAFDYKLKKFGIKFFSSPEECLNKKNLKFLFTVFLRVFKVFTAERLK